MSSEMDGSDWIFCDSTSDRGRFLFWTWEEWAIGGGGGVVWFWMAGTRFERTLSPVERAPLWYWYYFQKWVRKTKRGK